MTVTSRLLDRAHRLSDRSKAIGMFFATSIAGRVIGIGCQLCQVPLAVHALGSEAFGLWMTLTSVSFVIAFADFGVGQGTQNRLAEALAVGDDEAVGDLLGSSLVFMTVVGAAVAALILLVGNHVDFTRLFKLTDPGVRAEARPAILATLLLCCVNLPLGLAQRVAYARQQGWRYNAAQAAGAVGALAATALAAWLHWGLFGFMIAVQLPLVIANAVLLARLLPRRRAVRYRCRGRTTRELLGLGAYFAIQQVHVTVLLAVPPVMLSTVLGAAAVTPYNLAQRIFNLFAVIQNAFMIPLWPAYSDAKARGDRRWIRRTLRFSLAATLACTVLPMAFGAAFAHPVLAFWLHGGAQLPRPSLVWLLFLWNAAVFLEQPFGYLLAGMSEVKRMTRFSVLSGIASTVLMSIGVRRFGAEGLVLGMFVGYLPYLFMGAIAETIRVLKTQLGGWSGAAGEAWTTSP